MEYATPCFFILLTCLCHLIMATSQCPRERSRAVRKVVELDIKPLYTTKGMDVPETCPFSPLRDMYSLQEANIYEESPSKWICQFCGKSFYEQRFLDSHQDSRHADKVLLRLDRSCLSDYCDVFRCDVLSGKHQPRYWDKALCRERDLLKAQTSCSKLVQECMPHGSDSEDGKKLLTQLNELLCDHLNCERYWELPDSEPNPVKMSLYIISALFLMFGLFVYYYIIYTHFYTEESLLAPTSYKHRRGMSNNPWSQPANIRSRSLRGMY